MAQFHIFTPVALSLECSALAVDVPEFALRFWRTGVWNNFPAAGTLLRLLVQSDFWVAGSRHRPSPACSSSLGSRAGKLVAVGILRRTGGDDGLSAAAAAAAVVRGVAGGMDHRRIHRGRKSAFSPAARLHVPQRGPRLRDAARTALRPDDALRRRATGRVRAGRADDFRGPLGPGTDAPRRRGDFAPRRRPLQRFARSCSSGFRSAWSTSRRSCSTCRIRC